MPCRDALVSRGKRLFLGLGPTFFRCPWIVILLSGFAWQSSRFTSRSAGRHAFTHRRSQATQAGDLEIYDDQRQRIDTVTAAEIEAFAACTHAIAELVIEASVDPVASTSLAGI